MNNTKTRLRIYACGGAGINICRRLDEMEASAGIAQPEVCYFDTSDSNTRNIKENVFRLEGVDGSGKLRSENKDAIADAIRPGLLKYRPAQFNVVVFAGGGGSGSMFGPHIIRELLNRDENVLAVVLGCDESEVAAGNTLRTLQSLESVRRASSRSLVMSYVHHDTTVRRTDVDKCVRSDIVSFAALVSGENAELDTADITNMLAFDRVTSYDPTLAVLDIYLGGMDADATRPPAAMASLLVSDDELIPDMMPEYSCVGYRPTTATKPNMNMHFIISPDPLESIVARITKRVDAFREISESRSRRKKSVLTTTDVDDSDMVI